MSSIKKPAVGSLLKSHAGGLAADSALAFADQLQQKGMGRPDEPAAEEVPKIKTSIHFDEPIYTEVNIYRAKTRQKLSDVVVEAVKQFLERERERESGR